MRREKDPNMKKSSCKLPYPQRLKQEKPNKEFAKFFKQFNQLHINIPFADALAQMPSYTKFIKEMLMNKRKIDDNDDAVVLTKRCSIIQQDKLSPKVNDSGIITITRTVGNYHVEKAQCDSRREVKPSNSSLQFVDKSMKKASGVIEDLLVKVQKFVFPTNFTVDVEVDHDVHVIFDRPFLATGDALTECGCRAFNFQIEQ